MPRRLRLAIAAMGLALGACSPAAQAPKEAVPKFCVLNPPDTIGGGFSLVNGEGAAVTEAAFKGRPTLVYFGFTFCPDVCPLGLQTAKAFLEEAKPESDMIQPVFITLDPERDNPKAIKDYVASDAFPAGLQGLTGTLQQTEAAAKAFRVAWRKTDTPESAMGYTIDHSSYFYLMDKDWRALALFPSTVSPAEGALCLRHALEAN